MQALWNIGILLICMVSCNIHAELEIRTNQVNNTAIAIPEKIHSIRELVEYSYPPNTLVLNDQEIEQITWIEGINYVTSEMNILVKNNNIHVEIPRVLTKLYCLGLLRSGTRNDYNKFIEAQITNHNKNVLKYQSFNDLSANIKSLDPIAYKALRISTLLSSVSKSPKALKLALLKLGKDGISSDSVEFMSETMNKAMEIYPLASNFAIHYPSYVPLLKSAFLSNTHFRHMLYIEGGIGMFKNLRTAIKLKTIDQEKLNFWYCHWMINITGFRGHIAQNGSMYLNEDTFVAMDYLKNLLFKMLQDPNYNILGQYLEFRAGLLGIDTKENKKSSMILAHIGSMLRMYHKEQGTELLAGLNSIPNQQRRSIIRQLYATLVEYDDPTPTYSPALFANGLEYTGGNIINTLKVLLPVYTNALLLGRDCRKAHTIDKTIPTSFINISRRLDIQRLFNLSNTSDLELVIGKDGVLTLAS